MDLDLGAGPPRIHLLFWGGPLDPFLPHSSPASSSSRLLVFTFISWDLSEHSFEAFLPLFAPL
jgi:hypothetical protein